jgi:outer membrane protein OmpA-like peptidoglycan-associated protein
MQRYGVALVILALVICGCASERGATGKRPMTKTETGPVAGVAPEAPVAGAAPAAQVPNATPKAPVAGAGPRAAGAAPGAAAGPVPYKKNRTSGEILGAVGGGLGTGAVGPYMNSQKQDLQKSLQDEIRSGSASVDRLPHNVVRIRMHGRSAFETNSSSIKPGFCTTMDKVADVVIRYGKTTLTVVGPADNRGGVEHNRKLSLQRALSVAQYLESKEVSPIRLATLGKGVADLTASNGSDPGRLANRRVEIWLEPVLAR